MKILAFIDLHGSLTALEKIKHKAKNADIIICGGDFSIFEQGIEHFLSVFGKLNKPFLIIHGNHETDALLNHLCKKHKHLFFLHKNHFIKDDVLFLGWGGGGFSLRDEEFEKETKQFKKIIEKNKEKAIVLVTHAPPYNTKLDQIDHEHHGNKSITNFIKEVKPDLVLCGHFHENNGKIDKLGVTTIINPGKEGSLINL